MEKKIASSEIKFYLKFRKFSKLGRIERVEKRVVPRFAWNKRSMCPDRIQVSFVMLIVSLGVPKQKKIVRCGVRSDNSK